MKLKLNLVLIFVALIVLYGCASQKTLNINQASFKETSPVNDEAKALDDFIKPLLEESFGSTKLSFSSSTNMAIVHTYSIENALTVDNFNKLISLLSEKGYEVVLNQNLGDMITAQLTNDNDKSRLLVQGGFNENELTVSLTKLNQ